MIKKNINIIELITAVFILIYYKTKKAIKILSAYYSIKYIIGITIISIKKILYENTIIGQIITTINTFYSKYFYKIKSFMLYYNIFFAIIVGIFNKYLPQSLLTILRVIRNITTYNAALSLGIFIITFIKKLIDLYNYEII